MTSGNASTGDTSPPHHRVLLVDDHTFFRAGTRRILEDQPDFVVVGEAGNGVDTLALLETCDPEVVVLDINLPGMGGIALCEAIRQARPSLSIVILTGHSGEALIRALNKLGVRGYFLKSTEAEEFVEGLRKVCAGQRAFCREAQGVIDNAFADDDLLSPREQEVMRALARGLRNSEIARELTMTENTVEYHIRHLFSKLGASSRSEVIIKAQHLGWLDSQEPLC